MSLLGAAAPLQFTGYDLILCRNVLIYFAADTAVDIVRALAQRLAGHGYLLLGHAESSPEFERAARLVQIDGITVYRHPETPADPARAPPEPVPPLEMPPLRRPAAPRVPAASRPPRPSRPAAAAAAPAPESGATLDEIRSALSAGEAAEAVTLASRRGRTAPTDPTPHYLAALGALALGEDSEAEAGFRRALYLDKNFAMAHYLLGRHLIAKGRQEEGRRSLANALHAAAAYPTEAELPEGDGMTAGALAAAVRSTIG
jgi:chemotaxis protein methyltransferase CheR